MPGPAIFNVGGPERVSLLEFVQSLVESAGCGSYRLVPFPPERKSIDIGDYYADCSKIREALGWKPGCTYGRDSRRSSGSTRSTGNTTGPDLRQLASGLRAGIPARKRGSAKLPDAVRILNSKSDHLSDHPDLDNQ